MVALVRERYSDFGPTLAAEKLRELHRFFVSEETLRQWMKAEGLWLTRKQRVPRPHQPRFRRECFGELVQIDGCEHHWFEDRGPSCSLLVYVDDATSRLMELRFVPSESTFDYSFYSDKHSIFRVAKEGSSGRDRGVTQFARALQELNIDIICANSPQAKGRVERMNRTLQDRLVKELRLRGISTTEAANAFMPAFIEDHNARFARPARNAHDAHRPLRESDDLDRILTWQVDRRCSGELVVHHRRVTYLLVPNSTTLELRGKCAPTGMLLQARAGERVWHRRPVSGSFCKFRAVLYNTNASPTMWRGPWQGQLPATSSRHTPRRGMRRRTETIPRWRRSADRWRPRRRRRDP